jgi:hypothetical protein
MLVGAGVTAAGLASPVHALICYTLLDRTDTVIYRGPVPPIDMSSDGNAQRDALRASGQFLMFVDSESCPPVEYRFGEAGTRNLSVDNIIGGIQPVIVARPGIPSSAASPPPAGRANPPIRR